MVSTLHKENISKALACYIPGTTGRKPACCEEERIWRRTRSRSIEEHSVKLCFVLHTSASWSRVTSVRQRGHDVWFHSHLSTQHALQRKMEAWVWLGFRTSTFSIVWMECVLEKVLTWKRYNVITNAVTKLANRAFRAGFVCCTQCQGKLVSNLDG